jgi:hypothetical protein
MAQNFKNTFSKTTLKFFLQPKTVCFIIFKFLKFTKNQLTLVYSMYMVMKSAITEGMQKVIVLLW